LTNKILKIFIVATEQSGDNLGCDLIKELKKRTNKKIIFMGIGGDKMKSAGLKITNHISDFKSLGLFELVFNIKKIFNILNNNILKVLKFNPNLIITIDSPDFSFRFVKKLRNKKLKSKFIHYVAPTVWAWRPSRAKYISTLYDLLLTIFPFEKKYFEKYNLKTIFVGHPIFNNKIINKKYKNKNYIALLPGSRHGEIKNLMPYFKSINDYIHQNNLNYYIFIPTLKHLKNSISSYIKDWKIKPLVLINDNHKQKILSKTKFAIVCSGTAALEISQRKIPIIVIYKLNIITEFLFSFLIKVKFANIINIIKNKEIIPEVINHKLNHKNLIKIFSKNINNAKKQQKQILEVQKILKSLKLKNKSSLNASKEIFKII